MAENSNSRRLRRAHKRHASLLRAGELSAPLTERHIGIIAGKSNAKKTAKENFEAETAIFTDEAAEIETRARARGIGTTVLHASVPGEIYELVRDCSVTDLVFVGNGSLGRFSISESEKVDWNQIARAADHLKTGGVIQRTCALLSLDFSVPLGSFLVADQRNLRAAVGQYFLPVSLDDPAANAQLVPVFSEPHVGLEAFAPFIKTNLPNQMAGPSKPC